MLQLSHVILFLFAGVTGAAVLFMLAFHTAMVRELRRDPGQGRDERGKHGSLTLVKLERH